MALRESVRIIFDIIHDLGNAPHGISRGELVEKHGISASTAHKYIRLIEDMGVPIYTEGQRYFIEESYYVNLKLTSEEGEFLFLALERALTAQTAQSQVVRSLIYKLAHKLHPHLAGELQERFRREQSNMEAARIFTTLAQAKRRRQEVWVDYYPLNRAEASRWRLRPYRFVSNPLSDGFYVLGDGSRDGEAYVSLSLKFDRIQDARLSDEPFEIVDLARFQAHHEQAWGVWSSAREPVPVVLRFEPRHYDRLLESIWHPSQSIRIDADGYVMFRAAVSEPDEMVPWIRSWGSGVVVEEPEELRRRIIYSLKRQMGHYGLSANVGKDGQPLLHRLWAKRDPKGKPKAETTAWHPLVCHLLDVAAVARCMWDDVLSAGQKNWLQELLGLDDDAARRQLALLAGLHDIGKATPGFQKKASDLYDALCEADAGLRENYIYVDDHGTLSAVILRRWLMDEMGINKTQAGQLASVIGGHHGAWISSDKRGKARARIGKENWRALQKGFIGQLQITLGVTEINLPEEPQQFNLFAVFLSGFVSVCDWVGSNESYFPYEHQEESFDSHAYFQRSLEQAGTALHELRFLGWKADGGEPAFSQAFDYLQLEANELQRAGIEYLAELKQMPRLILVEYLTGGGKTELALHIGDSLVNRFGLSGAYIAMPTQATSNQMFERYAEYLQERYPYGSFKPRLIHGGADQQLGQKMPDQAPREGSESSEALKDWFQPRKRTLLAPFGIGTIDQAMLSVLQAKHHFVRQYALSQKLVIFDEIHSYDTYMNVIIERLLNWLQALQSPMIMLSATLSRQGRDDILEAVGAKGVTQDARYPRLTVVKHDGNVLMHPLPRPETRAVHFRQIPRGLDSLLAVIQTRYEAGGCIAIVCNTVNESIEVARSLRESEGIDADNVWLFHARFPPAWRGEIERKVLDAFGKNVDAGARPKQKILVATQIIEQSLDLDFDLMISSTAPIDLLIQRIGRLHRHPRLDRPAHLAEEPTLLLRQPKMSADKVPDFGDDEYVYERYFLLKSWLKLREMSALRTPDDIDALMDFVYNGDVDIDGIGEAYRDALMAARDKLGLDNANSAFRGTRYVIGQPAHQRLIGRYSAELTDDEERNIATRNIRPGLDIICVTDEQLRSLIQRKPNRKEVAVLLRFKIAIRHRVKDDLEQLEENDHWQEIPQLKFARAILFDGDHFDVPDSPYTLQLSKDYGLEIESS